MTLYSGMNNTSGKAITDIDHLRQSVRDILLTPQGSRIARREYGVGTDRPATKSGVTPAGHVGSVCGAESLGATADAGFHHHQQQF